MLPKPPLKAKLMQTHSFSLIGVPIEIGAGRGGCLMGPDSYRTAGLAHSLRELGHEVEDLGNLSIRPGPKRTHPNPAVHHLAEVAAWSETLEAASFDACMSDRVPVFMGGDHAMAVGSVAGHVRAAAAMDTPLFVLWLDAHPDLHTLETTVSGNLHGTPMGYLTGGTGFEAHYPALTRPIPGENVCMMGLRSVDPAERTAIQRLGIDAHDMRAIDENGVRAPLVAFLERVAAAKGRLHVSLDVDFLDPSIAPAVGTTVPGGATFREAHHIMELLHESGLVSALDLVELNPFLDDRGRTAKLMVDLCGSLAGRSILDRVTRSA